MCISDVPDNLEDLWNVHGKQSTTNGFAARILFLQGLKNLEHVRWITGVSKTAEAIRVYTKRGNYRKWAELFPKPAIVDDEDKNSVIHWLYYAVYLFIFWIILSGFIWLNLAPSFHKGSGTLRDIDDI